MLRTLGERQDVNYDLKGSRGRFGILRPVPYSALRGGSSGGVGEAKIKITKITSIRVQHARRAHHGGSEGAQGCRRQDGGAREELRY